MVGESQMFPTIRKKHQKNGGGGGGNSPERKGVRSEKVEKMTTRTFLCHVPVTRQANVKSDACNDSEITSFFF